MLPGKGALKTAFVCCAVPLMFLADLAACHAQGADTPARVHRIAVVPLKNLKSDPESDWIGEGAAETLTTKLAGVPGMRTIERTQIKRVLEEQNFQNTNLTDKGTVAKLGGLLGVERIVAGSFVKTGPNIMFNVRVLDVKTGEVLNAASLQAAESQIFDALFQLADTTIKSFDKKVVIVDNRPAVTDAPAVERIILTEEQVKKLRNWGTTSPDAYGAYMKGFFEKDPDARIRWLSRAVALDRGYCLAYNVRGSAYLLRGDYDQAIADFSRAIDLEPRATRDVLNRGWTYMRTKDYARAIADFTKAIDLDPRDAYAYDARRSAFFATEDFDSALADANRAIDLNPNDHAFYHQRGRTHLRKGDYEKAIADYNRSIELQPRWADTYVSRGFAYFKTGDYDRAAADYTKAIDLNPREAVAYYSRGYIRAGRGAYDQALADYGKSIELDPAFAKAYKARARVYLGKQQYDRAWADVAACRRCGGEPDEKFLEDLRKASGRNE